MVVLCWGEDQRIWATRAVLHLVIFYFLGPDFTYLSRRIPDHNMVHCNALAHGCSVLEGEGMGEEGGKDGGFGQLEQCVAPAHISLLLPSRQV